MALFAAHYAGNTSYYAELLRSSEVIIDTHEHFRKQTFRNRMEILGPNGLQKLVIPTMKTGQRRPMGEVCISYAEAWQKNHWKSLEAAYRRSPYFEFYEHRFRPFYTSQIEGLLEFNLRLHAQILELLDIAKPHSLTTRYHPPEETREDFRDAFDSPKPMTVNTISYLQVFSDRYTFVPNLSILDALFNLGPYTREVLR